MGQGCGVVEGDDLIACVNAKVELRPVPGVLAVCHWVP